MHYPCPNCGVAGNNFACTNHIINVGPPPWVPIQNPIIDEEKRWLFAETGRLFFENKRLLEENQSLKEMLSKLKQAEDGWKVCMQDSYGNRQYECLKCHYVTVWVKDQSELAALKHSNMVCLKHECLPKPHRSGLR